MLFHGRLRRFGFLLVLLTMLGLSGVAFTWATDGAENLAYAEFRHNYELYADGDYISNTQQPFGSWWGTYYQNWPDDTHEPIVNPNTTLITDSPLSWVWVGLPWGYYGPLAPNVTDPPNYMWFWETNLWEGTDPAHAIDIHAWEDKSTVITPGFSLERNVVPSRIRGPRGSRAVQLTVAILRIEQPLPESVDSVTVGIGAWWSEQIFTEFLFATPRPSLVFKPQSVEWHIPADQVEVGKTYRFRAIFQIYKRVEEDVFYKPFVTASTGYRLGPGLTTGKSVTINHPDGATAIFSGENEVTWGAMVVGRCALSLSRISESLPG